MIFISSGLIWEMVRERSLNEAGERRDVKGHKTQSCAKYAHIDSDNRTQSIVFTYMLDPNGMYIPGSWRIVPSCFLP